MQLSETAEVTHVHGSEAANAKLAEGWKLLGVVSATTPGLQSTGVVYILGKAAPEPKMATSLKVRFPT